MTHTPFNDGWTFRDKVGIFAQIGSGAAPGTQVRLPHDALISRPRDPDHGGARAFFPGGAFEYSKTFDVPDWWRTRRARLRFEGVYRDAMVFINGSFAAQRPHGYAEFFVDLDPFLLYGQQNVIRVEARSRDDSRWYTGAGIHRGVHLLLDDPVHVVPRGIAVTTPDVDAERAVVAVEIHVRNEGRSSVATRVHATIATIAGELSGQGACPVTVPPGATVVARLRMYVPRPLLWSPDSPSLYRLSVRLTEDGAERAAETVDFGIRTLRLDPTHGLRLNEVPVKLRGACLHHDQGILGAAAFARAEERKVRLLKEAGFNAIRAAHSPCSDGLLDACDRIGMLVVDEAFDVWADSKSPLDYSIDFPEWWERDLESMVAKDRNHPSVVMYSIGNEIIELGAAYGAHQGRRMVERIRELDPSRFITNGVNALVAAMPVLAGISPAAGTEGSDGEPDQGVNDMMSRRQEMVRQLTASPLVGAATEEAMSVLDVAGWNYADARYVADRDAYPNRVVVGSETAPPAIAALWRGVTEHSQVIGDFTWTGMDYLGEVGVGRMQYMDEPNAFEAGFPWISAWCGDLDLTGHRRPASYYREIVYGLRTEPYIAVQRPDVFNRVPTWGQWSWTDAISSWTWDAPEGSPIRVEVYADADTVELRLDGLLIGEAAVGELRPLTAVFELPYSRGTLEAIARRASVEVGRTWLSSAGDPFAVSVRVEREELVGDGNDIAFVEIELHDAAGQVVTASDRLVTVDVAGNGELIALGSGRPATTEPFHTNQHTTFDGRLLAVVRPHGAGRIDIRASAAGLESGHAHVTAQAPHHIDNGKDTHA